MEAAGLELTRGLIGEVGRVQPELVFVFAAYHEPAAQAVIDPRSGRDG